MPRLPTPPPALVKRMGDTWRRPPRRRSSSNAARCTVLGGVLVMSHRSLLERCPLLTRRVQRASGPARRTPGSDSRDTHGARHAGTTALWREVAPKGRATVVEPHTRVWQVWQVWQSCMCHTCHTMQRRCCKRFENVFQGFRECHVNLLSVRQSPGRSAENDRHVSYRSWGAVPRGWSSLAGQA